MQSSTPHTNSLTPRTFFGLLLGITLLALGLRLGMAAAFVGLASPPDLSASPDQGEYDLILQQMAAGHGYARAPGEPTARRAPGLVFTVYPVYAITGGSYAAVRLQIALMSAATCLLVGLLTSHLFTRRTGLIAAGLLALYPGHAYYGMHLLSEGPFGLYLALAVLLTLIAMRRAGLGWYAGAGLVWGMAVLTKPQFVLLGPLAGLVVLGFAAWRWQWRPVAAVAVCGLAGACVVGPWIVRNAVVLDAPGMSTIGGYTMWAGNNSVGYDDPHWRGRGMPTSQIEAAMGVRLPEGEAASDAQAKAYAKQFMAEHRADMPELIGWKLYRLVTPFQPSENKAVYWSEALSWAGLMPLLMVGWWIGLRRAPGPTLLMLGPVVITVAVTVVFMAITRYRNALLPVLVPFAAVAVEVCWCWAAGRLVNTQPTYRLDAATQRLRRAA